MNKKKRLVSTTAGLAVAAMLMGAGFVGVANAAEVNSNDITISAPAAVPNQLKPPTVDGRKFQAIRIASYDNAQVNDQGQITGYDLNVANGFTDALIRDAIKAAVTTTKDGNTVVKSNFANVVDLGADGTITFKEDAENLTAIQFVGKYFYGAGADVYQNDHANSAEVRTFADYLMKNIPASADRENATGANNQVLFDIPDGSEGIYLIIEEPKIDTTAAAFKGETVSRAMMTGTPIKVGAKLYDEVVTTRDGKTETYKLGVLNLKAEKVTITKEVEGNDQLIQLNSVRTFTIKTNVPNYTIDYPNWQAKLFAISDNPSKNINPFTTKDDGTKAVNNLKVVGVAPDGTSKTLTEGTDYTVDTVNGTTDNENDFKVSLSDPTAFSGYQLTVTYDGVITSTTPDGTTSTNQATVNDVTLDFSNNPNVVDDKATVTDNEKLYNAILDLEKVAFNDKTTKLAGAEFDVTVGGQPAHFTKSTDGLTYTLNKDASATGVTNKVVFGVAQADGTVKPVQIDGLAADTNNAVVYTFTETKAPAGYILGENPVTFTVTVTPTFDGNGESTGATIKVESATHANFIDLKETTDATAPASTNGTVYALGTARVENTTNIKDFAKTGGDILTMLALAGAAVVLGVGAGVAAKRRTNKA